MRTESWRSSEPGKARRWNHFPNTVEGRYNQLSQTIDIEIVSSSEFTDAVRSSDLSKKRRVLPLLWHEIRHWIDHTSTVWGQQDLAAAYAAISARSGTDETKFRKVVDYQRRASRDRFDEYYSVKGKPCGTNPPRIWQMQYSTGLRFDRDGISNPALPILFATFRWGDHTLARRSPISVAALLETAAMHFEIELKSQYLLSLAEEARKIQFKVLNEALMNYLYDPAFTEYSVAVHVLANRLRITDPVLAFRLSAALSYVALNLVGGSWQSFSNLTKWKAWGSRVHDFLENEDRGFAYFLLVHAAPSFGPSDTVTGWLDQTVRNAGLLGLDDLKSSALEAMTNLNVDPLNADLFAELSEKLAKGRQLFTRIGMTAELGSCIAAVEEAGFPPILFVPDLIILADGQEEVYGAGRPITDWLSKRTDIVWEMDEFFEICGV
jgi:hypothetical protein